METKEAIYGRRSVRKYLDKPIETEELLTILEGAVMAPSAVNNQPWYFLAVQSEEQMEKLRRVFDQVSIKTKAVLDKRFPDNPEVVSETLGFLTGLGNAPVCVLVFLLKPAETYDVIAVESTSAAIQNLCLMAYDLGIGSCWMTAPLSTGFGEILQEEFAADKGKFVAAVTLGYPAVSPQAPKRKTGRFEII